MSDNKVWFDCFMFYLAKGLEVTMSSLYADDCLKEYKKRFVIPRKVEENERTD